MAFNQFPYSNFHELNLDWLLNKVKEIAAGMDDLETAFAALKEWVTDYFGDTQIAAEVLKVLNQWLADGTISNMITSNLQFVPTGDTMDDYKADTLSCIASYLAAEYGSDCVIGTPRNTPEQVAVSYWDEHGYQTLLSTNPATRAAAMSNFSDTITIDGKKLHRMYLDCSAFVTLITKCRHYIESPYYKAFTDSTVTADQLLSLALENGDLNTKPYTFDWLNYIITFRMAYMMDHCGSTVKTLSTRNSGDPNPIIAGDVFGALETGDILFRGRSNNSNAYKGIHHVLYYVKDLADLNKYGADYGVTFTHYSAIDNDNTNYGYVVHVSDSTDGKTRDQGGAKNVLRVETLYSQMVNLPDGAVWAKVYTAKPYSTALLSSKCYNMCHGRYPMEYGFFESSRYQFDKRAWFVPSTGMLNLDNIGIDSYYPPSGNYDLNTISQGIYSLDKTAHTLTNIPPSSTAITAYLISMCILSNYRGLQIYVDGNCNAWFRVKSGNNTWFNWRKITTTTESA